MGKVEQPFEHLTDAQIEHYGEEQPGAGPDQNQKLEAHLADCSGCRSRVLAFHRARFTPGSTPRSTPRSMSDSALTAVRRPDCPSEDDLRNLAAGLTPPSQAASLIQHAAQCVQCGPILSMYTEDFSDDLAPEDQPLLAHLKSASSEWQQKLVRELQRQDGQSSSAAAPSRSIFKVPWFRRILVPATAAVCAAVAFFVWYEQRDTPEKVEKLLAQAYTEQRTMEMRWPAAEHAPIRVERAEGASQFSKPKALLEAEFRIQEELGNHPNDPVLLRSKAGAELLALDYKSAIVTLETALRLAPDSPELAEELGIAYYQSAEHGPQEYKQEQYAKALEHMSIALKLAPKDTSILFNRAILEEKMNFLNQAAEDWGRLLEIEHNEGWREEAQQHLANIRRKQAYTHSPSREERTPPFGFLSLPETSSSPDPEELLNAAERKILPSILHQDRSDPQYKVALAIANHLKTFHDDPFLIDLLSSSVEPAFSRGSALLAQSSTENSQGIAEEAYSDAVAASKAFQAIGNDAGIAAALFEQSYSLHFQSKAVPCAKKAAESRTLALKHGYHWLDIQSSLEEATCLDMQGQIERAASLCDNAVRLARRHEFNSFYLRALLFRAGLKEDAGDFAGAMRDSQAGLEEYFRGGISDIRAYSFYDLISDIAGKTGLDHVKLAAALEQSAFLPDNPNLEVVASAHFRVGNIALELGETTIAKKQFAEASRIMSYLPRTDSVRWRLLEAVTGLAKSQLADPAGRRQALETLESHNDDLRQIRNRYVEQDYFATLGEIRNAAGESQQAEEALRKAISLAETERKSAQSLKESLNWASQNARPYLLLTELLFERRQQDDALAVWEGFRSAPFHRMRTTTPWVHNREDKSLQVASPAATISYALTSDGILAWVDGPLGKSAKKTVVAARIFRQVAGRFMEECSRPDAPIDRLRADGRTLYRWLLEPLQSELPRSGTLYIRPDGILQLLPWEALVDDSHSYLLDRYSITIVPTFNAKIRPVQLSSSDKALIVGVPGVEGVDTEAEQVAAHFRRPSLLQGSHANLAEFKREIGRHTVLHFAGHAIQQLTGPSLVLVDGTMDPSEIGAVRHGLLRGHGWRPSLKLAVFSACSTASPGYGTGSYTPALVAEFLDSGAENVVASRWNIDSESTRDFMATFYRELLNKGSTVSSALHAASTEIRAASGHSHPYYWVAFAQFAGR